VIHAIFFINFGGGSYTPSWMLGMASLRFTWFKYLDEN
jgi:hypothetical protein